MLAERLEVRLDPERRRRLMEIATSRRIPVSEVVRQMIDETYQAVDRAERLRAAEELGRMEIEDVPEPDVLARQLDGSLEFPDLY
ncbi:MAG TPA: antitoxin [Chloroflexota bacterium]|nr:antitoxin [Chloroflexota bacterium]